MRGEKLRGLEGQYGVFDRTYFIPAGKFRRYHGENPLKRLLDIKTLLLNTRDFFKFLIGTFAAWRLLYKTRPDVVFSKGGFVVVPVCIAAHLRHVPIITHDSDVSPGLANRIAGRWAVLHTTGMPTDLYGYPKEKIRHVGIPIDEKIEPVSAAKQAEFKRQLGLPASSQVLLTGGAGLGAQTLNDLTASIAPKLLAEHPGLHVINITGGRNLQAAKVAYEKAVPPEYADRVHLLDFTDEFYMYTGAADMVITRAGATTLAELEAQRKAVVVVPAPFLAGGHQLKNAEVIAAAGAGEIVANNAGAGEMTEVIDRLLKNPQRRRALADNLGKLSQPAAAEELAKILLEQARGENVRG